MHVASGSSWSCDRSAAPVCVPDRRNHLTIYISGGMHRSNLDHLQRDYQHPGKYQGHGSNHPGVSDPAGNSCEITGRRQSKFR